MTDQDINREIAEALIEMGFEEKLIGQRVPSSIKLKLHDFTDPRYLFPALEAYCAKYQLEFTCEPYNNGTRWAAVMRPANSAALFDGDAPTLGEALRHAFHAVLIGGMK